MRARFPVTREYAPKVHEGLTMVAVSRVTRVRVPVPYRGRTARWHLDGVPAGKGLSKALTILRGPDKGGPFVRAPEPTPTHRSTVAVLTPAGAELLGRWSR